MIVIVMIVMIIMTTSGVRIVGWGALCFLFLQDPLIDLLEKMGIKPLAKVRKQRRVKRWLLLKMRES
ncbi:hypothetical protein HYSC106933_11510 [Hydrogenibacillus schlegelii]